jgi:hypothetical protein
MEALYAPYWLLHGLFFKRVRNYGPPWAMWRLSILGAAPDGHR